MLFMSMCFIVAVLLLVLVHEYGHFLVARWCGVKVLRFSFGFGKILARWHDKRGTEYTWSLIPLGGYIKMLDESEGEVPEDERHMAFNNKSIWARIAIVLGGPAFNILFAFVALWLVLVIGIQSLAPIIDGVKPGSIAAEAGLKEKLEILSVNGKKINGLRDVEYALALLTGTQDPVEMTVKSIGTNRQTTHVLSLTNWQIDPKKPDVLDSLGLVPFLPTIPPIVGEVFPESPAQVAGIQIGDVVKSIDGQPINNWLALVDFVKVHPDKQVLLRINRDGKPLKFNVRIKSVMTDGRAQGQLGLRSQDPALLFSKWFRTYREAPFPALGSAFMQTMDLTGATFALTGRLLTGKLSLNNISGPIGIAQGAGNSGRGGISYYLFFLAVVSISLGVLNILPIPMLDGGHLLYYLFEIILRRPLSERTKLVGTYMGIGLLVMLTVVAVRNDIIRLAG